MSAFSERRCVINHHFPSKNGTMLMVNWYWRQFLIPKRTQQKKWNGSKTVSFAIKGNGTPYQGWCNHCKESHCDRHVFFLYFPCILVSNLHYSVPNTSASNLKGLFLGEVGFWTVVTLWLTNITMKNRNFLWVDECCHEVRALSLRKHCKTSNQMFWKVLQLRYQKGTCKFWH